MCQPKRIIISGFDPFDHRPLMSDDAPYEPRKAAAGEYRAEVDTFIAKCKHVSGDILGGRDPLVTVEVR